MSLITSLSQAASLDLESVRTKYHLPALGAAVFSDNTSSISVTGVRKLGDPAPAQFTDKFHLGSCTKAMTATLLAIFIERKKLKWESTLGELFPEMSAMDPAFKNLKIEMLTSHRSGITGDLIHFDGGKLWEKLWTTSPAEGRKLLVEKILSVPPQNVPGSAFEYSNVNYVIVGHILERISAKSWESLMREELFEPLKMASCGFGVQAHADSKIPDQPWPHGVGGGNVIPITPDQYGDNPEAIGPAGSVHCSLADWGKFANFHRDGFNGKSTSVLKMSSFKKLHQNFPGQEYTYGGWLLFHREWAGGPTLAHGGSNTMNYATVWIAPLRNLTLLSVTNVGGESAAKATDEAVVLLLKADTTKSEIRSEKQP